MQFERVADIKTANEVLNDINRIPTKALKIINEFGTKIYCFNKDFKPSWIGLIDKSEISSDGRHLNDTSLYLPDDRAILIHDSDLKEEVQEKAFSTTLHEIGHALDYALGYKEGYNYAISCFEDRIYKGWQNNKGLDWYANSNPQEYFAQAFMAYCYKDIPLYRPYSYREHTREELIEKDNKLYCYLKSILN